MAFLSLGQQAPWPAPPQRRSLASPFLARKAKETWSDPARPQRGQSPPPAAVAKLPVYQHLVCPECAVRGRAALAGRSLWGSGSSCGAPQPPVVPCLRRLPARPREGPVQQTPGPLPLPQLRRVRYSRGGEGGQVWRSEATLVPPNETHSARRRKAGWRQQQRVTRGEWGHSCGAEPPGPRQPPFAVTLLASPGKALLAPCPCAPRRCRPRPGRTRIVRIPSKPYYLHSHLGHGVSLGGSPTKGRPQHE